MKNKIIKYVACAALVVGLAATAQAAQINGSVGFTGSFTANGTPGDLSTASYVNITINPSGTTGTGDLLGAVPTSFLSHILVNNVGVTFPASGLDGLNSTALWFVSGGVAGPYGFYVSTETQVLKTANTLVLQGLGTMYDSNPGNDPTTGQWQLSFGESGASFRFESTTSTLVPDGGMTVLLLGAALSGLALIRRKLA